MFFKLDHGLCPSHPWQVLLETLSSRQWFRMAGCPSWAALLSLLHSSQICQVPDPVLLLLPACQSTQETEEKNLIFLLLRALCLPTVWTFPTCGRKVVLYEHVHGSSSGQNWSGLSFRLAKHLAWKMEGVLQLWWTKQNSCLCPAFGAAEGMAGGDGDGVAFRLLCNLTSAEPLLTGTQRCRGRPGTGGSS